MGSLNASWQWSILGNQFAQLSSILSRAHRYMADTMTQQQGKLPDHCISIYQVYYNRRSVQKTIIVHLVFLSDKNLKYMSKD